MMHSPPPTFGGVQRAETTRTGASLRVDLSGGGTVLQLGGPAWGVFLVPESDVALVALLMLPSTVLTGLRGGRRRSDRSQLLATSLNPGRRG